MTIKDLVPVKVYLVTLNSGILRNNMSQNL